MVNCLTSEIVFWEKTPPKTADAPEKALFFVAKYLYDFQECGILTSVDSDEPVQSPFKLMVFSQLS